MSDREKKIAERWNKKHKVGTRVRYWSVTRNGDPTGEGVTAAEAEYVPNFGCAAVRITRERDGKTETVAFALTHVEAIP